MASSPIALRGGADLKALATSAIDGRWRAPSANTARLGMWAGGSCLSIAASRSAGAPPWSWA
eukprot:11439062-Alexandrium_andersonii.AAC.1